METPHPVPVGFSIALPAREQAEFIDTALSSIRSQRVPIELAVLDATPDDSVQRVVRAAAVPVAYGYHRRDDGQAAAIQEGWNHTTQPIVAWLCADDYYFPDALSLVADAFVADPQVDVVFGHAVHVSAAGAFVSYFPAGSPDPDELIRGCSISQPACFVRRSAMERVGGLNAHLHFTMDWDFWIRLHRAGCRFRFLDAPLAAVRVHPGTKTMSGGYARLQEIAALLKAHGVPARSRWRTQLGFLRQDIRSRGSHPLLRSGLEALKSMEERIRPSVRSTIAGLECGTNRVHVRCTVRLPWYAASPPQEAVVVVDRALELTMKVNERPVAVEPLGIRPVPGPGPTGSGYGYRAFVDERTGRDLSFSLSGSVGHWRLLGLAVH
ncbi:MAG: glycosyltransferase [Acidobacteria bacterium]|nr:glycosyltransferase [Acidobacteriota bacterium]